MVSKEKYKKALFIVEQYRKQLKNQPKLDIYEWLKIEVMSATDATEKEFEEAIDIWCAMKSKEIMIEETHKNNFAK